MLVPVACLVIGINYFVDPGQMYLHAESYIDIATRILSGANVGNVRNFNERLFQKYLIERYSKNLDVIVLGSSRSLQIGSNIFKRHSVLNNAVSGGSLGDFLGITLAYLRRGTLPKEVIIGVDPWIFNVNNGQSRWLALHSEVREMLKLLGVDPYYSYWRPNESAGLQKFENLLSLSYFQASIKLLRSEIKQGKHFSSLWSDNYFSTDLSIADYPIKLVDGRMSDPVQERSLGPKQILNAAIAYGAAKPVYSLENFYQIDPELKLTFTKYLGFLKSKGCRVTLYIPPYHKVAYDQLISRKDTKIILDADRTIRQIGRDLGLVVIGSMNAEELGLKNDDFIDGMHLKEVGVEKVFSKLEETPAENYPSR